MITDEQLIEGFKKVPIKPRKTSEQVKKEIMKVFQLCEVMGLRDALDEVGLNAGSYYQYRDKYLKGA